MKYFVSYFVWHRFPFANIWTPESQIILEHPLKWAKQYSDVRLMWWKEVTDAEIG